MFYTALAFDGTNGLLVGETGSGNTLLSGDIFTIDPVTGNQIAHASDTGLDFIGDLDFRSVPERASLTCRFANYLAHFCANYLAHHNASVTERAPMPVDLCLPCYTY
jgi:hypothetical protein